MKTLFLALVIIFYSSPILAQDKTVDKKFIFTSAFLVGASSFDSESTFAALDRCGFNCKEGNPLMRPLFRSGRPAVYIVNGALDTGIIYWSYRMKKDGKKAWWLMPVVIGAVHATAGSFNLRFVI